jgi:hypothetical protein
MFMGNICPESSITMVRGGWNLRLRVRNVVTGIVKGSGFWQSEVWRSGVEALYSRVAMQSPGLKGYPRRMPRMQGTNPLLSGARCVWVACTVSLHGKSPPRWMNVRRLIIHQCARNPGSCKSRLSKSYIAGQSTGDGYTVGPMDRSGRCPVGVRRRRQRQMLEVSYQVVASRSRSGKSGSSLTDG